jgi:hypothetical protein
MRKLVGRPRFRRFLPSRRRSKRSNQPAAWRRSARQTRPFGPLVESSAHCDIFSCGNRGGSSARRPDVRPPRRPQRSQVLGAGRASGKTLGCAAAPRSPSETPSRPAPSSRSTLPNSGKHGLAPPHNGAGVESFPTTLPQSLCHSRNAATGRDMSLTLQKAAGPPRSILT